MYKQTTHHVAYIADSTILIADPDMVVVHVSIFMYRKTYVIRLMYIVHVPYSVYKPS